MFLIRNLYMPANLWYYFEKWSFFIDTHVRVREIYKKSHIYSYNIKINLERELKRDRLLKVNSNSICQWHSNTNIRQLHCISCVQKPRFFLSLYSANRANLANSSYLYTWKTLLMKMVFLNPSCIDVLVNFKFKFLMLNDIIHTHSKIK